MFMTTFFTIGMTGIVDFGVLGTDEWFTLPEGYHQISDYCARNFSKLSTAEADSMYAIACAQLHAWHRIDTNTNTHARTQHTHARTHAHTHTHTERSKGMTMRTRMGKPATIPSQDSVDVGRVDVGAAVAVAVAVGAEVDVGVG
ncbi:hypothetical protein CYMTET_3300 [Cymbomonas tetramitiformis]|uniref:Uncharacterized protein n=1 Tax=Cymbomonas tetramitiformis TaxID=36881 RepID=A0AAE0LL86_9CHLO|nr:hypothetical protein CYMTET_3300 [Cymbomonas tetramitiformis]